MADAGWVAWTRYLGDKLTIPGWFVTPRGCGLQATGYKAGRFYVAGFWEVCYCKILTFGPGLVASQFPAPTLKTNAFLGHFGLYWEGPEAAVFGRLRGALGAWAEKQKRFSFQKPATSTNGHLVHTTSI